MTISFAIAVIGTYLAAGGWFTHGVITENDAATALDRSLIADGLNRLNPGAITALILFVAIWPAAFIASRFAHHQK